VLPTLSHVVGVEVCCVLSLLAQDGAAAVAMGGWSVAGDNSTCSQISIVCLDFIAALLTQLLPSGTWCFVRRPATGVLPATCRTMQWMRPQRQVVHPAMACSPAQQQACALAAASCVAMAALMMVMQATQRSKSMSSSR
jgi:hypothetical protein